MGKSGPKLSEEERRARRQARRRTARVRAQGVLQGVASMLRPDDVVLDCGANVGLVTGELAPSGAEIHAFEPDPLAFATLQAAFQETPNVHLHACAVGVTTGTVDLHRADDFPEDPEKRTTRSSILPGGAGMQADAATTVDMISLPDLIRKTLETRPDISLLKLDVEGAELDILEEMERDNLFARIRLTVAETHEGKFKELRPRYKALRQRITATYPITKVNLEWI